MKRQDPAPAPATGKDADAASGPQGKAGAPVDRPSGVPARPRAAHGYRNEVSWRSGQGRQPYANQDPGAPPSPAALPEAEQGDRGAHSGVHQQQVRDVRGKP